MEERTLQRLYYDRQLRVPGWGPHGQEILAHSTVLVVGVGGLGCPVLAALVRSGVGRLIFCDPDTVEASNLPRQSLFSVADVGLSKVQAAALVLAGSNPWIDLEPVAERVTAANVRALVEQADLVVDGSDNFSTKFLLHDACRSAGKPFVMASLYQWEAQVNSFDFRRSEPGCWRCLYQVAPEDGCVGVCAQVGVVGALAGLAGNFQALTALRLLLGLETATGCSTWVVNALDPSPRRLKWKPDPACACARGKGDWRWLEALTATSLREQAPWNLVAPVDRQVVIDLREPQEILPHEWAWFEAIGSRVIHARWSQWHASQPNWDPSTTYLLVCAHGLRSLAAVRTLPPSIRGLSLTGGIAELKDMIEGRT